MTDGGDGRFTKIWVWLKSHVLVAMAASLLLGIGLSSAGADPTSAEDVNSLRAKLRSVESQLSATERDRDESAEELDLLRDENDSLRGDIESLEEQVLRLNAKRPLPKLINGTVKTAIKHADQYGWKLQVKRRYSTARAGFVLSQHPSPGTVMRYQAPIKIVVAKEIPKIPDLLGLRKGKAALAAKRAGYTLQMSYEISSSRPETVIAMYPTAGSRLVPGQAISVTVAKKAPPPPPEPSTPSAPANCTPGYDPCLPPAPDYDCLGGSGDGPKYTGPVRVTGSDPYGLDADNDGLGCE